jgi:NAD(P)-dependent dehydrogenase (short-subunit alcohol dehydrogenase family)
MKTALIWGASGGIGRALVEKLDQEHWTVYAVSRHPEELKTLTPHTLYADVTEPEDIDAVVGQIRGAGAQIDLWIYAAGDITSVKVEKMTPETWQQILGANLTGAYLTTHLSEPILAPEAHLIYLGAVSERLRLPGLSAYAAAKAGLEAFAEALRKENRKRRVTVVRPTAVATDLWEKVPFRRPKHALAPEDVVDHVLIAYHETYQGTLEL